MLYRIYKGYKWTEGYIIQVNSFFFIFFFARTMTCVGSVKHLFGHLIRGDRNSQVFLAAGRVLDHFSPLKDLWSTLNRRKPHNPLIEQSRNAEHVVIQFADYANSKAFFLKQARIFYTGAGH